jgi:hypothetical protein
LLACRRGQGADAPVVLGVRPAGGPVGRTLPWLRHMGDGRATEPRDGFRSSLARVAPARGEGRAQGIHRHPGHRPGPRRWTGSRDRRPAGRRARHRQGVNPLLGSAAPISGPSRPSSPSARTASSSAAAAPGTRGEPQRSLAHRGERERAQVGVPQGGVAGRPVTIAKRRAHGRPSLHAPTTIRLNL